MVFAEPQKEHSSEETGRVPHPGRGSEWAPAPKCKLHVVSLLCVTEGTANSRDGLVCRGLRHWWTLTKLAAEEP